jgi:hypothetical protein
LKYEKCIHPASIGEIGKHQDPPGAGCPRSRL